MVATGGGAVFYEAAASRGRAIPGAPGCGWRPGARGRPAVLAPALSASSAAALPAADGAPPGRDFGLRSGGRLRSTGQHRRTARPVGPARGRRVGSRSTSSWAVSHLQPGPRGLRVRAAVPDRRRQSPRRRAAGRRRDDQQRAVRVADIGRPAGRGGRRRVLQRRPRRADRRGPVTLPADRTVLEIWRPSSRTRDHRRDQATVRQRVPDGAGRFTWFEGAEQLLELVQISSSTCCSAADALATWSEGCASTG